MNRNAYLYRRRCMKIERQMMWSPTTPHPTVQTKKVPPHTHTHFTPFITIWLLCESSIWGFKENFPTGGIFLNTASARHWQTYMGHHVQALSRVVSSGWTISLLYWNVVRHLCGCLRLHKKIFSFMNIEYHMAILWYMKSRGNLVSLRDKDSLWKMDLFSISNAVLQSVSKV